jgi:hypothetical protein
MDWQLIAIGIGIFIVFILLYLYNNSPDIYDNQPFVPVAHITSQKLPSQNISFASSQHVSHNIISEDDHIIPPPHPIKSPNMDKRIQMQFVTSSEECLSIEEKLVQDGKNIIKDIKNNISPQIPDVFQKYKTESVPCKLLLQAWDRYFFGLKYLSNYILKHELPSPPNKTKSSCEGCKIVEEGEKKFADNVRAFVECSIKTPGKCSSPKQQPSYDRSQLCQDCERIYNKWNQYIYALMAIAKYVNKT